MTLRHGVYPGKNNYLSKSYDNHLHDCDVASSTSSTYEEAGDKSLAVFDKLAEQIRGLKLASKSYNSLWMQQCGFPKSRGSDLTEDEVAQVEAFFKSHKTVVFVCRSLANLYFSRGESQWELVRTGVPVLILDEGETRARTQRLLQIVLAERATGFILWRDVINGKTNYRVQEATFHVMFMSGDRGRTAGLRFDLISAAMEFFEKVEQMVGDPRNLSLASITTKKNKRRYSGKKKKPEIIHLPRKCEISKPCYFQHVTNITIDDQGRFCSNHPFVQ